MCYASHRLLATFAAQYSAWKWCPFCLCTHHLTLACPVGQVFFYICFLNNTFICVLLFLGAGSVFNAATSAQPVHHTK